MLQLIKAYCHVCGKQMPCTICPKCGCCTCVTCLRCHNRLTFAARVKCAKCDYSYDAFTSYSIMGADMIAHMFTALGNKCQEEYNRLIIQETISMIAINCDIIDGAYWVKYLAERFISNNYQPFVITDEESNDEIHVTYKYIIELAKSNHIPCEEMKPFADRVIYNKFVSRMILPSRHADKTTAICPICATMIDNHKRYKRVACYECDIIFDCITDAILSIPSWCSTNDRILYWYDKVFREKTQFKYALNGNASRQLCNIKCAEIILCYLIENPDASYDDIWTIEAYFDAVRSTILQ